MYEVYKKITRLNITHSPMETVYRPELTCYSQTPKDGENPHLWAQSEEVAEAQNIIEQTNLLYLSLTQDIQHGEAKLFGATGSEENPASLSIWSGYANIPATAAWQLERKMISNPNELDIAKVSRLVSVISIYRELIQKTQDFLENFPKDLKKIEKFFPEKVVQVTAIKTTAHEKLRYLQHQEMHFKRLLIDIKKNLASGVYPEKLSQPIDLLLKQIESPLSNITTKNPHVPQDRSFEAVRNALLRPANDNSLDQKNSSEGRRAA